MKTSSEKENEEYNLNFNIIENDKKILNTNVESDKNELNDLLLDSLVLDFSKNKNEKETQQNTFPNLQQINNIKNQIIQLCDYIPEEKFITYCK